MIGLKEDRHIILIGFMGTGKSTLGAEIARLSQLSFIDLDEEIERKEGVRIAEIFTAFGESYFRRVESELLRNLLTNHRKPIVLATGGGAVLREENRQLMRDHGFIVRTEAARDEIIRRLQHEQERRPLLMGDLEERIDQLLRERLHAYNFVDLTIHTDQMGIRDAAEKVLSAWQYVFVCDRGNSENKGVRR